MNINLYNYAQCLLILPHLPYNLLMEYLDIINCKKIFNNKSEIVSYLYDEYNVKRSLRKQKKYSQFHSKINKYIKLYLRNYQKEWKHCLARTINYTDKLEIFFNEKNKLLWLFNENYVNKQYLIKNTYDLILFFNIKPKENTNNIQEMLYNYQYYNSIIKYQTMNNNLNQEETDELYELKDSSILSIINYLPKEEIQSYYINVDSKRLYFSLYEIYLTKYNIVLHSVNSDIKNVLSKKGCFTLDILSSKAHRYVNSTY